MKWKLRSNWLSDEPGILTYFQDNTSKEKINNTLFFLMDYD